MKSRPTAGPAILAGIVEVNGYREFVVLPCPQGVTRRLPSVVIRGVVCMLAAWADLLWDSALKGQRVPINRVRCGVYLVTISLAPLRAAVSDRAWWYWYLFAPTARGAALLAAQCELTGVPSPWLPVVVAGTLIAVAPPFGSFRGAFYRGQSILYAVGCLAGLGPSRLPCLRWMLVALAALEVLYFTGGWAWDTWWVFPIGQASVKIVAWGLHASKH